MKVFFRKNYKQIFINIVFFFVVQILTSIMFDESLKSYLETRYFFISLISAAFFSILLVLLKKIQCELWDKPIKQSDRKPNRI